MKDTAWRKWEVIGLFVTLIVGNLLHFVYDWSGENDIVAAFAAVNESVWEHMKLLSAPWILWTVVEALALRREKYPTLIARALGLLTGLAAIPILYYTYVGITGSSVAVVNIAIFQIAVLIAFWCTWRAGGSARLRGRGWAAVGLAVLLGVAALTVWWAYAPPQLPLFTDPQTGQTGRPASPQ